MLLSPISLIILMKMINLKAYAKINLGLRILSQRDDGYHNIETVFHRVQPHDEIRLEQSSDLTLTVNTPGLPRDDNNLCVKAAKLLQQHVGTENGVHIFLNKNIPIGAGLGGGSADAAATIIGLMNLWHIDISKNELLKIGLQLGSDVPYFLSPGTAYATSRGEILEYFEFSMPYWIVIIYPNIHVSTKWAYEAIHDKRYIQHESEVNNPKSNISLRQILLDHVHDPIHLNAVLHNDFEPIILHKYEKIAFAKVSLYAAGAKFAQMSGSGSAIYGLFTSEQDANDAAGQLRKRYQVFMTSPNFKPG